MDPELIDLLRKVSRGDLAHIDKRIAELEREIQFLRELKPLLLKRVAATSLPADPLKGRKPRKTVEREIKYNREEVVDKVFEHLFKHGPQYPQGIALALGLPEAWVQRATLNNEWFIIDAQNRIAVARERNNQ